MQFDTSWINLFWAVPFVGLLLSLSVLPVFASSFWHKYDGAMIALWSALVIVGLLVAFGPQVTTYELMSTILHHYLPFITLIAALFVISGNIHLTVRGKASPLMNVSLLFSGALLANFIGTTGAAMLLIRPLLKLNKFRKYRTHVIVFFIFLVANIGGVLTPLGDPPLFLGFLQGIDFFWPLKTLFLPFVFVSGPLLFIFWLLDHYFFYHDPRVHAPQHFHGEALLTISGKRNIVFLLLVIVSVLLSGLWSEAGEASVFGVKLPWQDILRDIVLVILAIASWKITPGTVRHYNHFSWAPLKEVAKVFLGIFVTILPVIHMLKAGLDGPFKSLLAFANPGGQPSSFIYFWLTGILSAFLDNAPTYLVFFFMAGGQPDQLMGPLSLTLEAISLGAVFMGALTYIGNAPNFMVKAIAEKSGIQMPSFFMYMVWSGCFLVPLFALLSLILLR